MFNLGVITDQISMDLEKSLKFIKNLGVEYAELHSMWDKNIEELNKDEINSAKKLLKKYQLKVSNISSTVFLQCSLSDKNKKFEKLTDYFISISGDYSFHLKNLEHCMELAEEFDTNKVRIFGFEVDGGISKDQIVGIVTERVAEPVKLAEKKGIVLILENCPFTYMDESILVKKVIENIGSKNLRALWDPGNLMRVDSKSLIPFPDEYNIIKDYISHIHIKDVTVKGSEKEKRIVPLGTGDVNYDGILKSLKEDEFKGILSLETELFLGKEGSIKDIKQSFDSLVNIYKSL